MKLVFSLLVCLGLAYQPAFAGDGCMDKDSDKMKASLTQDAKAGVMEVAVNGMTCAGCLNKLKSELKTVTLPKGVVLEAALKKVTINYSKAKLPKEKLATLRTNVVTAIKSAGFTI